MKSLIPSTLKTFNARKSIKALKAQMLRRNFWLLTLILLLSVITIWGLLIINTDVRELEQSELKHDAQLVTQLNQSDDIAAIQVEFKTQVQEWKDILLRGNDPDLYQKYWQQFEQSEAKVHAALYELHRNFLAKETQHSQSTIHKLAESPSDQQAQLENLQQRSLAELRLSDKVTVLIEAHELVGKLYRAFLSRYPLTDFADNAFFIDQNVRGIDRWLAEQLLQLHNESIAKQKLLSSQANAQQAQEVHELRLHIQRSIAGVIVMLIINLMLIQDRLRNSARELSDATKKSEAAIYELAYSDSLTGLPNRRLFHDRLDQAIALSSNTGRCGGLIFLDLDNFKTLNDTKGHAQGDLLLIEVANRLRNSVRASDTVARLGGDEFVVILDALRDDTETASEQASAIAEKICLALNQPYHLNNYIHHGGASIGVALFNRGEVDSDELIKRADTAMYQAKRAGRNTVRFYDQHTQNALEARGDLEHKLHSALEKKDLELYFQVQVDQHKKPTGAEGLIRWHHPELGLLHPSEFIPLAEESDLIITLGNWVLNTACATLKRWEESPATRDLTLSINVSTIQLRKSKHVGPHNETNKYLKLHKPNFVEQVQAALIDSGINPARLELEITESIATQDIEYTIETLLSLKALGVCLAVDDFGIGHSSLTHLKRMPINQIKVDQSFVQSIDTDNYDQAIVKSMLGMVDSLKIGFVAEGVETHEQEKVLLEMGCVAFQGFLFGKPMPAEAFEQWLEQQYADAL